MRLDRSFTLRDNTCSHGVLVPKRLFTLIKLLSAQVCCELQKRSLVRSTAKLCARFAAVWVFDKLTNRTCAARGGILASPVHYKLSQ